MTIKKWRLIWLSGLAIMLVILLMLSVSPSGKASYKTNFIKDSYFFGKLSPQERIVIDNQAKIVGEPVYFSLFTHRPFSKAKLTIDFSTPPDLLEIGLRRDKTVWNFDLKPLYSSTVEKLASSPKSFVEDGIILWQKEKKYNSLDSFLSHLPRLSSVISYRYALPNNFKMSEQGSGEIKNYKIGLRGAFQFYTYSSGQPIELSLDIKDRNESVKPSDTELNIYKGSELVSSQKVVDEQKQVDKNIFIRSKNLEPGVYRVELKADDDIISENLKTAQKKIAFTGRLWIVESDNLPKNIYSDSETISAQTNNPSSRQTVLVDGKKLNLEETYKQFSLLTLDNSRKLKEVVISKRDIILSGDGVWSFSKDCFFDPTIKTLTAASKEDALGADYLIASYLPVQKLDNGFYRASVDFDLNEAYREDGKYSFMISAPMADLSKQPLIIKNLKVDLSGASIKDAIYKVWQTKK